MNLTDRHEERMKAEGRRMKPDWADRFILHPSSFILHLYLLIAASFALGMTVAWGLSLVWG